MIPVVLLLGSVLGRWWRTTIAGAALAWPALLVAGGVVELGPALLAASALAAANAGVGVLVNRAIVWVWRSLRSVAGPA